MLVTHELIKFQLFIQLFIVLFDRMRATLKQNMFFFAKFFKIEQCKRIFFLLCTTSKLFCVKKHISAQNKLVEIFFSTSKGKNIKKN